MTNDTPLITSAALLVREDGRVLLVRHGVVDGHFGGAFAGLWSLPMLAVAPQEVAEDALERVLSERLHVQPGTSEFADTLYITGADGARYVVNVFTCVRWQGEPRFSEREYQDAAWVDPAAPGPLELPAEVRRYLGAAFGGEAAAADPQALASLLEEARVELIAAYEAIPAELRALPLEGVWSPLDVLAHSASAEAFYVAESRRLLEVPGHVWRFFNPGQWEDDHRSRPPEPEQAVRTRLAHVREQTLAWLRTLDGELLAAYGNHPQRGLVTVADRLEKTARHDREHAGQLRSMLRAARVQRGVERARDREEPDAAADR